MNLQQNSRKKKLTVYLLTVYTRGVIGRMLYATCGILDKDIILSI